MAKKKIAKETRKPVIGTVQKIIMACAVIILLVVGTLSGALGYAAAYARCLKPPVVASKFAASYSFILPGEEGYGPDPFGASYFCTRAEAEKAGFQHSPLTEGGRAELFSSLSENTTDTSKLDFTVYAPKDPNYSLKYASLSNGDGADVGSTFVSADLLKNGNDVGVILMRKMGTERSLCDPAYYECVVIGVDSQGREVKKVVKSKNNVGSRYNVGVQIGNTSITVFSDTELVERDIIEMFGTLQPDTRPLDQW